MVAQDVWLAVEFASYPRNSWRFFFFSFLRETGGTPHTVLFLEIETKQNNRFLQSQRESRKLETRRETRN